MCTLQACLTCIDHSVLTSAAALPFWHQEPLSLAAVLQLSARSRQLQYGLSNHSSQQPGLSLSALQVAFSGDKVKTPVTV